jgi:hypothetical protein
MGRIGGRRILNDVRRRGITPARTVYPRREAILSEADGLSLSVSPGVNYRLGKSAWSLLGQIMTDAPFDQTVAVFARELLGIGRRLGCGAPFASPSRVIVGTLMVGPTASLTSTSSYFGSPGVRPSRQR